MKKIAVRAWLAGDTVAELPETLRGCAEVTSQFTGGGSALGPRASRRGGVADRAMELAIDAEIRVSPLASAGAATDELPGGTATSTMRRCPTASSSVVAGPP